MGKVYFMPISAEEKQKAIEAYNYDFRKSMTLTGTFLVAFYKNVNGSDHHFQFDGYRIWQRSPEEIAQTERSLIVYNIEGLKSEDLPREAETIVDFLRPSKIKLLKREFVDLIDDITGIYNNIEGNDPQVIEAFVGKLNSLMKEFREVE